MSDAKTKTGDPLGGSGRGGEDDIYDEVAFGEAAAHGGAYMSLREAEAILEFGAVIARLGAPPATVQGRGRLRWSPGPAGAAWAAHEPASFDRRIGPEGYVYLVPLEQFGDRARSRRLTLQSLREKVEAHKAAGAPSPEREPTALGNAEDRYRVAKYQLGFEDAGGASPAAARFGVEEWEARGIRRAARAARRSGAVHAAVAITERRGGCARQARSPTLTVVGADGKEREADLALSAAELKVNSEEFWVWACGEGWSGATERRAVSELLRIFGLRPL